MPHRFFKRLPPYVREQVLVQLQTQSETEPVSISRVVHLLSEEGVKVEMSEIALKSSIAEAALERGFVVAFDGT